MFVGGASAVFWRRARVSARWAGNRGFPGDSRFRKTSPTPSRRVDCCVLIEGESGTGKRLVARRLHSVGLRFRKPSIPVTCAGVSEPLFEDRFFGHVRGAFTGAEETMLGLVRTVFGVGVSCRTAQDAEGASLPCDT